MREARRLVRERISEYGRRRQGSIAAKIPPRTRCDQEEYRRGSQAEIIGYFGESIAPAV